MNEANQTPPEMQPWQYDKPPTLFDFVQNNALSNGLRIVIHLALRMYLAIFHCLKIINRSILKDLTSTLIAANHSSHLDVLAIQAAFPSRRLNKVRSLAAKDYFFNNPFIRVLTFFIANTIPLSRKAYDPASLGFSQTCLQHGANIILFPEGTRTLNGEIQSFQPGIGMMSVNAQAPILPIYIAGTYESFSKGKFLPKPKKITVVIGELMRFEQLDNTKESWHYVAREVETSIRALKEKYEKEAA